MCRYGDGGAFVGEGEVGLPASGIIEEAAVGISFDVEEKDKVSNFYSSLVRIWRWIVSRV